MRRLAGVSPRPAALRRRGGVAARLRAPSSTPHARRGTTFLGRGPSAWAAPALALLPLGVLICGGAATIGHFLFFFFSCFFSFSFL